MLRIGVIGCAGRMGREICRAVAEEKDIYLAGGTEIPTHDLVGKPMSLVVEYGGWKEGAPNIAGNLEEIIGKIDVVIDFSAPKATMKHFNIVNAAGKGIVIGTTGFTDEEIAEIRKRSSETRCVIAPNMSVGVNLVFKLVAEAAKAIGREYDIEIMDIHHNKKKDSPSGTAARLAEICANETGRDMAKHGVYGREGDVGERTRDEIGVMSFRAGDVVGEHTVMFTGIGERVEVSHKAWNRGNFARGAVKAAKWLAGKNSGIYDMQDVLGLR